MELIITYVQEWWHALLLTIAGTGVTLGLLANFCSKFFTSIFLKKYDLQNNEKLETLKSELMHELEKEKAKLGNKTYISKVRFDAEFQIYRELSSAFF